MFRMIETFEFAPEWLKKAVGEQFTCAILFRNYGEQHADMRVFRDRTGEAHKLLVGFEGTEVVEKEFKGHELLKAGWEIAGAALAQDFKIVYKR